MPLLRKLHWNSACKRRRPSIVGAQRSHRKNTSNRIDRRAASSPLCLARNDHHITTAVFEILHGRDFKDKERLYLGCKLFREDQHKTTFRLNLRCHEIGSLPKITSSSLDLSSNETATDGTSTQLKWNFNETNSYESAKNRTNKQTSAEQSELNDFIKQSKSLGASAGYFTVSLRFTDPQRRWFSEFSYKSFCNSTRSKRGHPDRRDCFGIHHNHAGRS